MANFTDTTTVSASPPAVFNYLSDVANLPRYFSRLTSAEPGPGEQVHTTAKLPDGKQVSGDAWFRIDQAAQRIEWGSEGPSAYAGHLAVRPAADGSEVEVHLHTTRVSDDDPEVRAGVAQTLARIKQQTEAGTT